MCANNHHPKRTHRCTQVATEAGIADASISPDSDHILNALATNKVLLDVPNHAARTTPPQTTAAFLSPDPQHPTILHASTHLPETCTIVIFVLRPTTATHYPHPFPCMLGTLPCQPQSAPLPAVHAMLTTIMLPGLNANKKQLQAAHSLLAALHCNDSQLHVPPRCAWEAGTGGGADVHFLQAIAVEWQSQLRSALVASTDPPETVLEGVTRCRARASCLASLATQLSTGEAAAIVAALRDAKAPVVEPLEQAVQAVGTAANDAAVQLQALLPLERACLSLQQASLQVVSLLGLKTVVATRFSQAGRGLVAARRAARTE